MGHPTGASAGSSMNSALPLPVPAQPSDVSQSGWGSGCCPKALGPHWRPLAMPWRTRRKFWGALVAQPHWAGVCGGPSCLCPARPMAAQQPVAVTWQILWDLGQSSSPKLQGDFWGDKRGLPHLPPVWIHADCVPHGAGRQSLGGSREKSTPCSLGASPG